jgi:hypothetical protein
MHGKCLNSIQNFGQKSGREKATWETSLLMGEYSKMGLRERVRSSSDGSGNCLVTRSYKCSEELLVLSKAGNS